jgi:adenosylhomocysteinase
MELRRGHDKIEWAAGHMPLLGALRREFAVEQPFRNRRIAMSIHLEAKTACLAMLLRDGGGRVAVTGSNPLSTQDDVASALSEEEGISVHARRGVSSQEYTAHLRQALDVRPDLVLDDGGDLVEILHEDGVAGILGGCEETTTGVMRLRRRASRGKLAFPMFAVNDAQMKHLFDNRHGTGQSVWDALLRSTNLLVAGKNVVVAGYGWCGRGIALRARGLGGRVTVTEVDPVRAGEAVMDGFDVAPLREAIRKADFVVTATGCVDVVTAEDLAEAKDGVLLANAGHFNVEINLGDVRRMTRTSRIARDGVAEHVLHNGRRIYILGEGRLVNLVLGDGHPVEIMDISFALQALTLRHIAAHPALSPGVYAVPDEVDQEVARRYLASIGTDIDTWTEAQRSYMRETGA